jgi:predicted Zn-dependent protease
MIGYRQQIRMLCLCFLALVTPGVNALDLDALQNQLKDSSKIASETMKKIDQLRGKVSKADEIEIGAKLTAGLLGAAPLVADARLQRYVNNVGYWVAVQSKRKKLPWRFGVIQSAGINAFAAPGGYIVVTLGLYQLLENEAQLAAVLAHEIAHVVRKHHLKALQKTMKRDVWSDLAVDAVEDKQDSKTVQKLINSGLQLYTTGLDRKFEFEADLLAVVLAARAGYDPYAFLDVLTTIDSINPDSSELTVLMNTHPPTSDRLETLARKMDGRLDSYAPGVDNADRFRRIAASR